MIRRKLNKRKSQKKNKWKVARRKISLLRILDLAQKLQKKK